MALIGTNMANQIAVITYRPIRPGFLRRPVTIFRLLCLKLPNFSGQHYYCENRSTGAEADKVLIFISFSRL